MEVKNKVVMVLDDDVETVQLCERMLNRAGFETLAITTPKQGLAILQQARVDLLIVDIHMPTMDGFEVMKLARAAQPDLAVLVITGHGTLQMALQALRAGANGLVLKPFASASELIDSVQRALEETENHREAARLHALRPLIDLTQTLFAETDLEKLPGLLLETTCQHLHCAHAGFYLRQASETYLAQIASRGSPLPGEETGFAGGVVGYVDAWGTALRVLPESGLEPQIQETLTVRGWSSLMCAPALRGPHGNSVVLAARGLNQPPFTAADFEMFSILSRQAGVAIENAHLYAELRDYIARVEESQRALIQAEKMAAIGRITASIAHEINNPLQAVRNCLHLAGRKDLNAEKRRHYLGLAQTELERLMNTVQQMLAYYRPGAFKREPADLNQLVRSVLALLEQQLRQQEIAVRTDFAPDLPPVFVVRNQFQQVFFNITLNAMEAIRKNGTITIQTAQTPTGIEVIFQDSGPGIPLDQRERIFEPFMSTKEQGTGLGLSVSYSIVEAHGGKLDLSNPPGEGARFRVSLPLISQPQSAPL